MADKMRLDRFLVEMDMGTRSEIKEAAKKGRIRVNGEVVKKTDGKIDPEVDQVTFDTRLIEYASFEYYMLNKPQGVVSATNDNVHKTVIALLEDRKRNDLFPVGRLDLDTEGLLLITNDGDLAHQLLSPRKHVDKVYYAEVDGMLPEDAAEQFAAGITLSDGTETMPAQLKILNKTLDTAEIELTIHEGKFHQVKRMFEALECQVVYLKRMSMGPLKLDTGLEVGEYRELTEEELYQLRNIKNVERES